MASLFDWKRACSSLMGALRHRGCSAQDAEDLIQEACLKLLRYEQQHEVAQPDAFLMRAALNLAIDAQRTRRNHGWPVELDEVMLDELLHADPGQSAEAVVLARERILQVSRCLARLKPRTRDIFLAHRLQEKTYAEIAAAYGLSISAIEQHVVRATIAVMQSEEGL
jgi:RNA polymerase sigma factor (sigma-70 family)